MNLLCNMLKFIGLSVCLNSSMPLDEAKKTEGVIFAQIEEADEDNASNRHTRNILLQSMKLKDSKNDDVGDELDYSNGIIAFSDSKSAVFLPEAIPVLDQGKQGTCVTFSSTAAVNVIFSYSPGVSQQCILALNLGLGNNFWNGAMFAGQILSPLKTYGVVALGNCNGVDYPDPKQSVKADDYKSWVDSSIPIANLQYKHYWNPDISVITNAIDAKHYLTVGFRLANNGTPISVQGFDVIVGGNNHVGGLWACQQPSNDTNFCAQGRAGHEVLIVGYDNDQQLLKIRNSWGAKVGDGGDFYMTYEFFSQMVMDATEVWK